MTNITLTMEQFEALISRLTVSTQPQLPTTPASGNFSKCASRFNGVRDSDVNAFIDAITVYKDCTQITDENALKGLPMLLDGFAATWYQGVRSSLTTWQDALALLRTTFGPQMPPYRVYRELFAKEQDANTPTDVFVCQARSVLSKLPDNTLAESVQIDMVYGLLHRRIREKVPRDKTKTFSELLTECRLAEETFEQNPHYNKPHTTQREKVKCSFCRYEGHTKDECRKFAERAKSKASVSSPAPAIGAATSLKPNAAPVLTAPAPLACYGCGKTGYVRANCPSCKTTSVATTEFLSMDNLIAPRARPVLHVSILGHHGCGLIDTAAKQSVAGYQLFHILKQEGQLFQEEQIFIKLADGTGKNRKVLVTHVDVELQHRKVSTRFIILPEAQNRTLFGIDFLQDIGLEMNIGTSTWNFCDTPELVFPLTYESKYEHMDNIVSMSTFEPLRSDEGTMLDEAERERFNALLQSNKDIFKAGGEPTPYAEHYINTGEHLPVALPPYRIAPARKQLLKAELDNLLEAGIIEECEGPWAAPIVLVPKSDGSMRLCVDYQRLNAITVSDAYPLPRMDDLLHAAKRTNYMSTIDLQAAYHQVPVHEKHRDKTGFVTPFGSYRFLRMPFGLKNAPATFQRLIDRFRRGLSDIVILAYLDDIIVLSDSFDKHIEDLQLVFDRLRQFCLRAKRSKCVFARSEVKFLGHLITKDGISVDPKKTAAIANRPAPRDAKQVLSFLQTCSWYRRFVANFAEISKPLSDLTKKGVTWQWSPQHQTSFETLKTALVTAPILQQNDETKPYVLRTDASAYALGAVLLQGEGAEEHPIEYASRLLNATERNYSTTEREALAVVWALDKFRGYVEGTKITIQTDHQPLRWLLSLKAPTGRLARWALSIQNYDLHIEYLPGKRNVVADTLSRPPCDHSSSAECDVCSVFVEIPRRTAQDIRAEQLKDPEVTKIIRCFESPDCSSISTWTDRGYLMANGVLYRYVDEESEEAQLVVPAHERERILREYHDDPTAAHYGAERTLRRIARRYYFTGMRRYISEYVKNCPDCQRYKASTQKPAGLLQTPVYAQRFETLSIDLFGPLPESKDGKRWILIIEDISTKFVELFALERATAEECACTLVDEVCLRYGLPRKIISDNGVQFVSSVMQKVCYVLGIKQSFIPLYHAAANMVERKNRDLKPRLALLVKGDHTSWPNKLPKIRFAMNTAWCETTGYTASYLTFGRELRTLDDVQNDIREVVCSENFVPQITPYLQGMASVWKEARTINEKHQDRQKPYADAHRRLVKPFEVGDRIWVTTHTLSNSAKGVTSKFNPKRDGPYMILRQVSATSYEIANPADPGTPLGVYHVSALTPVEGIGDDTPVVEKRKRGRPPKRGRRQAPSSTGHSSGQVRDQGGSM